MAPKQQNAAITPFLSAIGNTEVTITKDGESVTQTNYELLAQQMWDWAMGWTEQVPILDETGRTTSYKPVYHPPDKTIAKSIYDRMEGRTKPTAELPDDKVSKPVPLTKRIGEQVVKRLNKYGEKHGDTADRAGPGDNKVAKAEGAETDIDNAVSGPPKLLGMFKNRAGRTKTPPGKPPVPPRTDGGRREG